MEVYAFQSKDRELAANATVLRRYAKRRLGVVMAERRAAGKLAKGAREPGVGRRGTRVAEKPALPTLADQGIDKNLANEARKAAAMPEDKFEASVKKADEQKPISNRKVAKALNVSRKTVDRDSGPNDPLAEKKPSGNRSGRQAGGTNVPPALLSGERAAKLVANKAESQETKSASVGDAARTFLALLIDAAPAPAALAI
jgi:hypothetical protein